MWLSVVSALVLFFGCYSSNAELLEEGTTVTKEIISSDGEITEIEETTTTVTHGSHIYLDSATTDVGGAGSIYSHSATCTAGFPDGRASPNCGRARTNNLTTWDRFINLQSFGIEDGGKIDYEFYFAFPNDMYQNESLQAYTELKGYDGNTLVFQSGQLGIDKDDFQQNQYTTTTNWTDYVTGSYDYTGSITKLWARIAGWGQYFWDEYQVTTYWNQIDVTVQTYFEIIQPQIIATEMQTINTIDIVPEIEEIPMQDIVEDFGLENFTTVEVETVDVLDEIPVMDDMPIFDEISEVNVAAVEEIQQLDIEPEIVEVETKIVETEVKPEISEIKEPTNEPTEPVEDVEVSEVPTETEDKQPEQQAEETEAEEKPIQVTEKKDAVQESKKESSESKQKPEEEKKESVKQDPKKTVAEKKTEKAKQIMSNFDSLYTVEAQNTQLLLIMALGADIQSTTSQLPPQINLQETINIQENVVLDDLYGDYMSVGSSLKFQAMVDSQYE